MTRYIVGCLCALWFVAGWSLAQNEPISDDAVNAIAGKMYCPVCENIPLDDCNTATCIQWKAEIRDQLAAGLSEEAIIADFVARFGDHVLGVPQDPFLRALSLVTPWLFSVMALVFALVTFFRWRKGKSAPQSIPDLGLKRDEKADAVYRERLERDVLG